MGNPGFYEGKPRGFAIFRGLTNGHGAPRGRHTDYDTQTGGAKHRFAVLRRGLRMVNTAWAGTQFVSASTMDSRSFKM